MHVAIDGVGNHVGGGWSVLTRTVSEIADDPRISRISVLCSPLEFAPSRPAVHQKVRWLERHAEHQSAPARLAWYLVGLQVALQEIRPDVVVTMNGAGITKVPRICVIQQAFTVAERLRDVRPLTLAAKLAVLRNETLRALPTAAAVVVQTTWMRARVRETLSIEADVLSLGLCRPRHDIPYPRTGDTTEVAIVGSALPYKRRDVSLAAIERAGREIPELRASITSDETESEVARRLERAAMLIVASDVESFGLPIVEAFAARCPVILTDKRWARAVADNAAMYFTHGSAESAAARIVECARDPQLGQDVILRGEARLAALWEEDPYRRLVDRLEEIA